MKKLKGTFTNREIIVWVALVYLFAAVTAFHWLGFVVGAVSGTFAVWTCRKTINQKFELSRLFRRTK